MRRNSEAWARRRLDKHLQKTEEQLLFALARVREKRRIALQNAGITVIPVETILETSKKQKIPITVNVQNSWLYLGMGENECK